MKVKDYLSGAFTALAITIVGGIVVYYATKEPEQRTRESLAYSVRSSASFSGTKEQMSVASVNIQNRGGKAAKNVIATVQFDSPLIRDLASESIPGAPVTKKVTDQSAVIEYPVILPGESVSIDLLLKSPAMPEVAIRSDESLARQLAGSEELMHAGRPWNAIASALVPLSGLFLGVVSAFTLKTLRSQGGFSDKNNTGFLLLHSGLVDEAESVLLGAVRDGSYDPFTLSNLATCYVVRGDVEKAKALISAANYHSSKGHASAVLALNQAFLHLHLNERVNAMESLQIALEKSPNEIRRYLTSSVLFNPYRSDPDFIALLKSA